MKVFQARESILKKRAYHFLHPGYWPMWLAFGLLRVCVFLPYPVLIQLGKILGRVALHLLPKKKKITQTNLRLCFPEKTQAERDQLLKKNFESVGIGLLETALAWWASDKRLKQWVQTEGLDNLYQAQGKNKGVLLATCHFTCIELGIRLLSFFAPIHVMYRPQNNQLFEWMLQKARQKYVVKGIMRYDPRGLMRALKGQNVICYTPDQDYGREASVFAPFFGISASTVTGTSRFLRQTGATLCLAYYFRNNERGSYTLQFFPPLENFPAENEVVNATRINSMIESTIRKYPEQYIWQHRRFKTRPTGEKSYY